MTEGLDYLQDAFRHFAGMCEGESPLYAALAPRIADDPAILALALERKERQPPVNLLLGVVHDRLLAGTAHPLAEFYPSRGGRRPPAEAFGAFKDFCAAFAAPIAQIVSTRRVQTNEVGRCGLLLPAFALAWERFGRRPLHLIEVGASAGLNLLFDRYRYEYTADGEGLVHACGPDASARIRTALRGQRPCPLPETMPPVAGRVGVDIAPIDVTDDAATRWVNALIWPDQLHRIELFRAAVALARTEPPQVIAGDGLELVPQIIESGPRDALPCVFHSHAIYLMNNEWRERFAARLAELGRRRDLARISLEWLRDDPGPKLHLTAFTAGGPHTTHLADCHHHGAWMRWLEPEHRPSKIRRGKGPPGRQ